MDSLFEKDATEDSKVKSCSQRRREARRIKDPHGSHPFKRFYLGPSPVSSQAANSIANAIAEDIKIEKPTAIGVVGKDGTYIVGRSSSFESAVRPNLNSNAREDISVTYSSRAGNHTSPKKRQLDLSPLRIPRSSRLSHYSEKPDFRRHLSREASFASAKSMPDSVLSEGDLRSRQESSRLGKGKSLRRDASAMADISYEETDSILITTPSKAGIQSRRRASQSSYEPSHHLGRKKLSFEVMSPKDRRGRSEGDMMGSSILKVDGLPSTDDDGELTTRRHFLDVPVNEGGSHRSPLRNSASHRSIGQMSKSSMGKNGYPVGFHSQLSSSPARNAGFDNSTPVKLSDPTHETADTSTGLDTSESAKLQRLREQSRKRYGQSNVAREGFLPRTSTLHSRDISRQSRMSRASTAGTFASIGTRFSEGSFGASGGVRSKLAKTFKSGKNKAIEANARDLKLEHKSRDKRVSIKGGVLPGAVGTSAGGTKWVGQTFEIGKRFWEVVESREEELEGDTIDEEAMEEERLDRMEKEEKARLAEEEEERVHSRQASANQTTEGVLDKFARQAQEANDEHEQTVDTHSVKQLPTTPALTFTESDSDNSKREPQTPPKHSLEDHLNTKSETKRRPLTTESSQTSFITVPQDRGAEHESSFDIENRHGWSDVVSFISAQSSARTRKGSLSELGAKARQALDSNFEGLRARQNERKAKKEEARSALSRLTIREASNGSIESSVPSGTTSKEVKRPQATGMTAKEALSHPEPPLGAEDRFPLATYELLRRNSNPGVRPADIRDDAASDHEVAARPTTTKLTDSPNLLTPNDFSSSYKGMNESSSTSNHRRTISTGSFSGRIAGSSATSSTPILQKMPSAIEARSKLLIPFTQDPISDAGIPSILQGVSIDTSHHTPKKSVQFLGSSSRLTPPLGRPGFSASLFHRNSPLNEKDGFTFMAGRVKNVSSGDAAPAPPSEVLSRNATPDGVASPHFFDTSPGLKSDSMLTRQSVLKRDRMLVRLAWTPSENLPKEFNERESRKYSIYSDSFKELMVVYRTGRLELWEDPSFVSKCLGHSDQLNLYAATSLKRGKAFVSMYSPIDRIFCLTFTKDDDYHHRLLDLRRSGTCIWIFDARSMTIGTDWMWELSRELGVEIPDYIDVHLPALSVRVRIPVPEEMPTPTKATNGGGASIASAGANSYMSAGEGYKLISRDYVKKVVRRVVEAQPEWRQLCLNTEVAGLHFELAWRNEGTLDWIKEDSTNGGKKRDWAVLVGRMISEYRKPSVLEYRPAFHYPTSVRLPKGEVLREPPGVEGFLWRVKAVSGALTRLYITTHDGLIFVNRPSKAFPPDRHLAANVPESHQAIEAQYGTNLGMDQIDRERRRKRDAMLGRKKMSSKEESLADLRKQVMETISVIATSEEEIDAQIEAYRAFEKRRQFEQVSNADGYVDVRDIVLVRSLDGKGPVRRPSAEECGGSLIGDGLAARRNGEEEAEEEEEDLGGEEGLALAHDRVTMKRNRQFEVTLSNGRTICFEAYSKSVSREWVERLAIIAHYWKRREKVDALELMAASGLDPALIGKRFQNQRAPRLLDKSTEGEKVSGVLGGIWNWCLYDSCRGILKSGRLFQKKKAYSGFSSRYYILIAGRLLYYKLMTSNRTARSRQNSGIFHKRQETVVHLRDAYVYSGKLSEDMLVNGRSEGAGAISTFGRGTGGAASAYSRHTLPRVYGDGLLSVDDDEDCTFVIRYRPQRVNQAADPKVTIGGKDSLIEHTTTPASPSSIPILGDKTYNHLILRARSKLERDLWVRAINVEIERLNREDYLREEKIRETGQTPWKPSNHHHLH